MVFCKTSSDLRLISIQPNSNQTEEITMSKDYRKSDYGINKYSEGIVYRYADGHSITITFEMIAAGNPTFTQDDFDKIKAFSDDFYHREAKAECNQSYYVKSSLDENINSDWLSTISLEVELFEKWDKHLYMAKAYEAINSILTPTQRKRLLLHINGLTTRQIAEIESINGRA